MNVPRYGVIPKKNGLPFSQLAQSFAFPSSCDDFGGWSRDLKMKIFTEFNRDEIPSKKRTDFSQGKGNGLCTHAFMGGEEGNRVSFLQKGCSEAIPFSLKSLIHEQARRENQH